jgi:hypothetical protein
MQENLPKTAEICHNLPKGETLKYHQKSRFQCFSEIKISTCKRGTRACFHCSDFQSKNFSYAIFIVKKRCEFQHTPLRKIIFFGNPPQLW